MTKAELIEQLAHSGELNRQSAERIFNAFLEAVKEALCRDGKITLAGLGTFAVEGRECRRGRNPRTGEEIEIPACKVVKFRPSKVLKEAVDTTA